VARYTEESAAPTGVGAARRPGPDDEPNGGRSRDLPA